MMLEIRSELSLYFAQERTTYEDFNRSPLLRLGRSEKDRKLQITVA